jgi:hypothetical protein
LDESTLLRRGVVGRVVLGRVTSGRVLRSTDGRWGVVGRVALGFGRVTCGREFRSTVADLGVVGRVELGLGRVTSGRLTFGRVLESTVGRCVRSGEVPGRVVSGRLGRVVSPPVFGTRGLEGTLIERRFDGSDGRSTPVPRLKGGAVRALSLV